MTTSPADQTSFEREADLAGGGFTAIVEVVDATTAAPTTEGRLDAATVTDGSLVRRRRGKVLLYFAMGWLGLICLSAVFADLLPLRPPGELTPTPGLRPGFRWEEPLGTDALGRSELSRLIYGARVSLAVGAATVVGGMLMGGLLGTAAGYIRGRVEKVINVVIDSALAFPPLILLLALTAMLTPSLRSLIIALTVVTIPSFARLARANTLPVARREFVSAARTMGATRRRILFREILPNVAFPVASYAFLITAIVIVAEGSLSFLGLGIPPPQPSWGNMIALGRDHLHSHAYQVFVPATVMLLTVFSLNIIGDHARRRFDKRESVLL